LASSVKFGMLGAQLKRNGDKPDAEPKWRNRDLTCYFSTPIPVGKEHAYLVTGAATLTNAASHLRCIEVKTGKELWKKEKVAKYHAALLRTADDKLIMLDDF